MGLYYTNYTNYIFNENKLDQEFIDIFKERDKLLIFKNSSGPYTVTLGAPHQVPYGLNTIGYDSISPRKGDTSSGILALGIYRELDNLGVSTKLVIKSRASGLDPNKYFGTDYTKEIFAEQSQMLFEVHGKSSIKVPLEFSAGQNDLSRVSKLCLFFYEEMREKQNRGIIDSIFSFGLQEKSDKDDAIVFTSRGELISGSMSLPALKSTSLLSAESYGMSAMHLEAAPEFRFTSNIKNSLTSKGVQLSKMIAVAIYKYFIDESFE